MTRHTTLTRRHAGAAARAAASSARSTPRRQAGQDPRRRSHGAAQRRWSRWPQGSATTFDESVSRHTAQASPPGAAPGSVSTTRAAAGHAATAAGAAGAAGAAAGSVGGAGAAVGANSAPFPDMGIGVGAAFPAFPELSALHAAPPPGAFGGAGAGAPGARAPALGDGQPAGTVSPSQGDISDIASELKDLSNATTSDWLGQIDSSFLDDASFQNELEFGDPAIFGLLGADL